MFQGDQRCLNMADRKFSVMDFVSIISQGISRFESESAQIAVVNWHMRSSYVVQSFYGKLGVNL